MPDDLPGSDVLDEPVQVDEPGDAPLDTPPAEPGEATDPPADGADPAARTEGADDDPDEWKFLADRFKTITDEKERKAAIGRTFLEKTRFASQVRQENEKLEAENERLRAERAPKTDPAKPHPDVVQIDARITTLTQTDERLYGSQQKCLVAIGEVNGKIAVAKHLLTDADESARAQLEQRLEDLEGRKTELHEKFDDLNDRRDGLKFEADRLTSEKAWTEDLVTKQGQRQEVTERERLEFEQDFPKEVVAGIDKAASAFQIKDKAILQDLKDTVIPRLTMKFWKLGQSDDIGDVDVKALIATEVGRYAKSRDLAKRAAFRDESTRRLQAPGASPAPAKPAAPAAPRRPGPPTPSATPKNITALGLQDIAPSMLRAREKLAAKGL
jgi:cell division protein FtsB